MKKVLLLLLVGGAIYSLLQKERRRSSLSAARPDLNQWEGEGGAVPAGPDRTAAQVQPNGSKA